MTQGIGRQDDADQSGLTPAALMIGHHLSISPVRKAARPAGVCCSFGATSMPRSAKRLCTIGSASTCIIAPLSFALTSFGKFFGPKNPNHPDMYRAGARDSSEVGISGMVGERCGKRLAIALIVPAW